MKILLAYPNFIDQAFADLPLGIVLLGTTLQKHGIDVDLIATSRGESWDSVRKKIELSKPDVLGISILTPIADAGFEMAKMAKEILPNVFVIMGGPHATVLPLETLENRNVDAVALGEGEETLVELVEHLDNLQNVSGIYYKKKGGGIMMNPLRSPIEDLDKMPFPDWSLLPSLEKHFHYSIARELPVLASRGCPFNCIFCQPTLRKIFGEKIRYRSSGNVVDEIEYLIQKYNVNSLIFLDDTLTVNRNLVFSICEEIIARGIKISWVANGRVDTVTEEMLGIMKKAGCQRILFGVESGSEYIRNSVLKKQISTETIKKAFKLCRKVGIRTLAFIMLGSPGETKQTLQQTLELIKEIKPDYVNPSRTTPLPGTFLWDKVRENGSLNVKGFADYYMRDFKLLPIKLEHVTEEDIRKVGEAIQVQQFMMHLREYIPYAFHHPLRAVRRLFELHIIRNLFQLLKNKIQA